MFSYMTIWMDFEDIRLTEISHTEIDKCHMISIVRGI